MRARNLNDVGSLGVGFVGALFALSSGHLPGLFLVPGKLVRRGNYLNFRRFCGQPSRWKSSFSPLAQVRPSAAPLMQCWADWPWTRDFVQSVADNGVATASSGLRSASTPKRGAISAAASISTNLKDP